MSLKKDVKRQPISVRDVQHANNHPVKSEFFEEGHLNGVDRSKLKLVQNLRNPVFTAKDIEHLCTEMMKEAAAEVQEGKTELSREQRQERRM